MLWSMAFDRVGVVAGDLYFLDPDPTEGQEGAERGVRLELRLFERDAPRGSIYAGVPVRLDRPLWRVDLLGSVESPPGTLDRAHHHPRFDGWEPGARAFLPELSADPVGWLGARLADLWPVLFEAGVDPVEHAEDVERLEAAAPEILAVVEKLLAGVADGSLAREPATVGDAARASWL
jgi:hypothetical protein